ncbi:MAG: aldo/keto reductase [Hyphomicrobiaceae bacterium]
MEIRQLGKLWPVSVLTLGGGGIGQLWGETTREESIATVRTAVDSGIMLLDMAPAYGDGEAEHVIGAAFEGQLPAHVRVTTKHRLGTPKCADVRSNIVQSLQGSLARMRLERVDLFFLHSNIVPDDYDTSAYTDRPATRWATYIEQFIPVCEELVADGRIGAWGITGIGIPDCILAATSQSIAPSAIQCISNPLDSPGELKYFEGPSRAREIIAATNSSGAGVLGIRPVQGGALTDTVDRKLPASHAVNIDYGRADRFRALARELDMSAATLAHRYALTMDAIDTVVLGCKNRHELLECISSANAGPLETAIAEQVDAACAPIPHH